MIKKTTRKIKSQYQKYLRVWHLLAKPSIEEFKTISKVTVAGLLIIGALGFVISVIMKLII